MPFRAQFAIAAILLGAATFASAASAQYAVPYGQQRGNAAPPEGYYDDDVIATPGGAPYPDSSGQDRLYRNSAPQSGPYAAPLQNDAARYDPRRYDSQGYDSQRYDDQPGPNGPGISSRPYPAPGQDVYRPSGSIGAPNANSSDRPATVASLPPEEQPEQTLAELPPQFRHQLVNYPTREPVGTIIIDTAHTYLYLVMPNGQSMRYGIGVGREGFTWNGTERISRMKEWPDWFPPKDMIERQPYLPRMMAGGEGNPLGARALYLGNTLYRIHGTNQPSTIGTYVSSGCIRLTNAEIGDLYSRVQVGTRVVVLPGKDPKSAQR